MVFEYKLNEYPENYQNNKAPANFAENADKFAINFCVHLKDRREITQSGNSW